MLCRFLAATVILLLSLSPATAKDSVSLQLPWDHQFQFAGYYAAELMGFYAAADLDVTIRSAITAEKKFLEPPEEVLSGRADFGIGSGDIILANQRDNRLRVIASIFQSSATRFYVKQDKHFASLADLVEKATVARRLNSFVDIELQALLRSEGIDPAKLKSVQARPGVTHFLDDRAELIAGYSLTFPYEIGKYQVATTEINPLTYGINFYGDSIFTSRELIEENPELVERFLAASLKGWRYALENPEQLAEHIARHLPRSHPLDNPLEFNRYQAQHINQHTSYPIVEPGHINPHRWQKMHQALQDAGLVKSDFDPAQLIWTPAQEKAQQSAQLRRIGGMLLAVSLSAALVLAGFVLLLKKLVKERTTSLLQANQKTQHRQAEFEAVFHSITDAIVLVDQQRHIVQTNKAFSELFGYLPDEVRGQTTERLYADPSSYEQQGERRYNPKVQSESPLYQTSYRRKDGSVFAGETLGVAVTTEAGETLGFLGVIRDISARLESEKKIRELSRFPDESPGPVLRSDQAGRIGYANQASLALMNECGTGVGQNLPEKLLQVLRLAVNTRQSQVTQLGCGEQIYSFVVTPVAGEDYVNLYGQDITESKNLEYQLRQSEKMQAIGQLAGGIAHDFNNQLGVIIGSAELLDRNLADRSLRKYVDHIKSGAARAAELTQKLLAFGRKGKYLSRPVDMNKLIEEVSTLLEHSIDKRIRIRKTLHCQQSHIIGDPALLQNALLNLALNARDAMPEGGEIGFEIDRTYLGAEECRRFAEPVSPGRFLLLKVTDSGCGMDEDTLRHIFEPFFTTKAEGRGTGLGLASVYGTVRNHSGAIRVHSKPGQGTQVCLYLPQAEREQTKAEEHLPGQPLTGEGRILIVDDEQEFRELIAELLTELGYSVSSCQNGREALSRYQSAEQRYDLVILDMIMPELNGRDTFIALQKIDPAVRVILSSGFSDEGDIQQLLDLGVISFIGKPYQQQELSEQVAAALLR